MCVQYKLQIDEPTVEQEKKYNGDRRRRMSEEKTTERNKRVERVNEQAI